MTRSVRGAPPRAFTTIAAVPGPSVGADWVELTSESLPVEGATTWATTPGAGAVVAFCGVVRDQSEGRAGVVGLS